MRNCFFKYLSLVLLLMFVSVNNIYSFVVQQVGDTHTDNLGYGLPLKLADTNGDGQNDIAVICTDYYTIVPHNQTCNIDEVNPWSAKTSHSVATIINTASSGISLTQVTSQYFAAEMAINVFLKQKGEGASSLDGENLANGYSVNGTYYDMYKTYLDAANNAYNSYPSDTENFISLSTNSLTFTKKEGNYVSNTIEVTSTVGENYGVSTSVGNVVKENDSFYIVIPLSEITVQTDIVVDVVSNSKSYIQAKNYSCGSGYQTVTPLTLDSIELSDTDTLTGTITPEKGKLTINKTDSNNVALSGAKILVTGTSTGYNKEFITNGTPIIIEGLEYDTYVIEETEAPVGYSKADIKRVTLSTTNLEQTVNLVDEEIKISILKTNEVGGYLEGATLKLTDKDGNTLKICGQNKDEECKWVTTKDDYVIEKIPSGTYYLKEVSAPDTYDKVKESKKIVILGDGSITVDGKSLNDESIKFTNKLTRTEISKVSASDGKELPGATIEILDANKEKMSCVILNDKGKKETLKECTWVSGEESTIIIGLSKGKYYIKETIAPEGYVLSKEMVEFEVKGDGTVTKAVMKNDLEVKVPDTLSARSTLLIAISMFDIALGIGILTYVKKNKAEE